VDNRLRRGVLAEQLARRHMQAGAASPAVVKYPAGLDTGGGVIAGRTGGFFALRLV